MEKIYCKTKRINALTVDMHMHYDKPDGYEFGRVCALVNANEGDYEERLKKFLLATVELYDEIVLGNSKHYREVFGMEVVHDDCKL